MQEKEDKDMELDVVIDMLNKFNKLKYEQKLFIKGMIDGIYIEEKGLSIEEAITEIKISR